LHCDICGGLIANLPVVAKDASEKLRSHEFATFLIGASIPQEVLDKEDEIRARLKIKGKEGIKTEINRSIAREISKKTGGKLSYSFPDITILVSLPSRQITITPRSIWLFARYQKKVRGLPQRASLCKVCGGVGCAACGYRGSPKNSIQSIVNDFLTRKFEADNCNFIWIGSEDENSLVKGNGRPFYIEIQKPKKRKVRLTTSRSIDLNTISLSSIELLTSKPSTIPRFTMKCIVYLVPKDGSEPLKEIMKTEIESKFKELAVRVRLSKRFRVVRKIIHSISVERCVLNHPFALKISCDGGIPIKKLVLGDEDTVSPNVSEYLKGFNIDPEMPFDIQEIRLSEPNKLPSADFNPRRLDNSKVLLRKPPSEALEEHEIIAEKPS
jgi:tRNA pseudouridine synthase 10